MTRDWYDDRLFWPLGALAAAAITYMGLVAVGPRIIVLPLLAAVVTSCCLSARFAFGLWWLVLCTVPYWIEVRVGSLQPPTVLICVAILPAVIAHRAHDRWRTGDWVFVAFLAALAIAYETGGSPKGTLLQIVAQGTTGYLVGRHIAPAAGRDWIFRLIALTGGALAAWSILEYVGNVHLFTGVHTSTETFWADLLDRNGHARSEAAFGHPIVLGAVLAASVPFILASLTRGPRVFMLLLVAGGLMCTVSRGPLLAALLGIALMVCFGSRTLSGGLRFHIGLLTAVIGIPIANKISVTVASSGQEATVSTSYRGGLYDQVFQDIHPLSLADNIGISRTGEHLWRAFGSIDSTFIAVALDFGWVPVAIILGALAAVAWRTVRHQASAAQIALLAQFPVLATVALITQYRTFVFLLAGLAVAFPDALARGGDQAVGDAGRR